MIVVYVYLVVAGIIAIAGMNDDEPGSTVVARALVWPVTLLVAMRDEVLRLTS